MYAQIQKVIIDVDLSNGCTKSSLSGLYNNKTASLGLNFKMNKSNLRIYGSNGYSTYILIPIGYNSLGMKIPTYDSGREELLLDFTNFSKGIYLIHFMESSQTIKICLL